VSSPRSVPFGSMFGMIVACLSSTPLGWTTSKPPSRPTGCPAIAGRRRRSRCGRKRGLLRRVGIASGAARGAARPPVGPTLARTTRAPTRHGGSGFIILDGYCKHIETEEGS
jgi:hypothetical protein